MSESATIRALTAVIESLQAEVSALRSQMAKQQDAYANEIRRLVTMVEGLTKQLDVLLRDQDDARRAEVARLRNEAREAKQKAEAMQVTPAPPPNDASPSNGESPDASTPASNPEPAAPEPTSRRHNHGRRPIPEHVPRDTTRRNPDDLCGLWVDLHPSEKTSWLAKNGIMFVHICGCDEPSASSVPVPIVRPVVCPRCTPCPLIGRLARLR